jgi:hypothetical protein
VVHRLRRRDWNRGASPVRFPAHAGFIPIDFLIQPRN